MAERLVGELMDASNGQGSSVKRREDHAQDGRGQQGLRPLPMVIDRCARRGRAYGPGVARGRSVDGDRSEERRRTWHRRRRKRDARRAARARGSSSGSTRSLRTRNIGIMAHIDAGQDDDDRAHPLLHGQVLQGRRGPRGHRPDGLDGPGAGARHHDHRGRDHVHVEGPLDQHHRHARPRRLHRRGRAVAARARRRRRGLRRGGRRRAADRDRLAPGRPLPRSPHLLRQQDGPDGRRLRADRPDDRGPPARRSAGRAAPVGRRGQTSTASSTWSR